MLRFLSSLQARLVAGFALALSVALLSVGWYVSGEAGREAERSEALRMEARVQRVRSALDERLAEGRGWSGIQPDVERLGRLLSARVLVWDGNEKLIADSHKMLGPRVWDSGENWGAQLVTEDGDAIGTVALMSLRPFPGAELLEPVDSDLADHVSAALLWAGLAAGGVGIIAVALMSRRALAPVRALSAAAEKLGGGDLSQRVLPSSGDEIGRLGHAFNRMAEDLESAERQRKALLADVAHELRTPLSNIGGYVEAMRDGLAEPNGENLEIVRQQVSQLTRLVEDLRLLTLAESGALELHVNPESMNDLLVSVSEAFGPRARANAVAVSYEPAPGIPLALMDRGRVEQVLQNLVENAVTHAPTGGAVTLQLSMGDAGSVRVSVRDTGEGIDEEALEAVFERFYRVDPSRSRATGGAGLGLTIAKQLIEAQGGRIWAESEPGQGSAFIFELPSAGKRE